MTRYLLLAALAVALLIPARASAMGEYVLVYTNYDPYYTQVVAGPFDSYSECSRMQSAEGFSSTGIYSCNSY